MALGLLALASRAGSQTIDVFTTVYTPPGDPDGPRSGTIFVPAVSNGIGAVIVHGGGSTQQSVSGWRDALAAYGYIVMSIDYPDQGAPPDVYPNAARAVKFAVQYLRRNAARFGITTNKIVGVGMSQGAITLGESIIWDNDYVYFRTDSTINDHFDAAVLLYGWYDFTWQTRFVPAYYSNDSLTYLKGTCLLHFTNITTPVLLIHGTGDTDSLTGCPYTSSVRLYDSLNAHGKSSELLLFPGRGHAFDAAFPGGALTADGVIAKDTALAFLGRTVASALKIRVNSSTINFGSLLLTTRDTATVLLDNIGSSALGLQSISTSRPEFKLIALPSIPQSIQPGSSIQLKVAFQASGPGVVNDTLTVESDDLLHPVVKISLQGKGVASVAPAIAGVLYTTSAALPGGYLLHLKIPEGALDTIGPLGISDIRSMSIRRSDGLIYAATVTSAPTSLYQIDARTGEASLLRRLPIANLSALAFSPGDTLFGATTSGTLYRFDLASGRADSLGTSPRLVYSGLSFRPGNGELWASVRTPTDSIFKLNRENGAATFLGITGFSSVTSSIAFDTSGTLFGLIDNGTGEDYLVTLDSSTGSGTIIAGPLSVNYLRAITMAGGTLPVSVRGQQESGIPGTYELSQNFPNPFNPSTVIKYTLAGTRPRKTTLVVYDLLGREVATLVSETQMPGYYKVPFDGSRLSTGVYYYRLTSEGFVQTRAMTLLK